MTTDNHDLDIDHLSSAILEAFDESIKEFGTYTLVDKGVHEIMDIAPWIVIIKKMTAIAVVDLLYRLQSHEHGDDLAGAIIGQLDSMPDEYWDTIVNAPGLGDYY